MTLSTEKFDQFLDNTFRTGGPDGVVECFEFLFSSFVITKDGVVVGANDSFVELIEYSRAELYGMSAMDLIDEDEQIVMAARFAKGDTERYDLHLLPKSKRLKNVTVSPRLFYAGGEEYRIAEFVDITEKIRAEQALYDSEERFRTIYENAPVLINAFDENGLCVLWNKECQKTFGWTIKEMNAQKNPLEMFYPDPVVRDEVLSTVTTSPDGEFHEWNPKTKDGRTLSTMWANFRLPDGMAFNMGHDITKRKETEGALLASLQEKEILLKEIHHRVKNNLQVIVSLLRLQANRETEPHTLDVLRDSQRRIDVMAKLHESIYLSNNLSTISIRDYLVAILNNLLKSIKAQDQEISFQHDVDDIKFSISQSMALGQIVSELVSNCFKHAFVGRQSGSINLSLHRVESREIMLTITDDGKGFPENYNVEDSMTLGLKLVKGLAQQLDGSMSIEGLDGARVRIQFPESEHE